MHQLLNTYLEFVLSWVSTWLGYQLVLTGDYPTWKHNKKLVTEVITIYFQEYILYNHLKLISLFSLNRTQLTYIHNYFQLLVFFKRGEFYSSSSETEVPAQYDRYFAWTMVNEKQKTVKPPVGCVLNTFNLP